MFFNVSTSRKTRPSDIRIVLLRFQSQFSSLSILYMFSIYVSSRLIFFHSQYLIYLFCAASFCHFFIKYSLVFNSFYKIFTAIHCNCFLSFSRSLPAITDSRSLFILLPRFCYRLTFTFVMIPLIDPICSLVCNLPNLRKPLVYTIT